MQTVAEHASQLLQLGAEVYRMRVSVPVLVELAVRATGPDADFLTRTLDGPLGRETVEASDAIAPRPRVAPDAAVHLVRKRPKAPFPERIGIGRAGTDVVLAYPLVSKYHAFIREDDDRWFLCDAGSRNGTFFEHVRLERGQSVPLTDECMLRIGPYGFFFYSPDGFLTFLQGL